MTEPMVGLEDVVIATSTICFIDGDKGILAYRGYAVNDLAEKSSYGETAYLLLYGHLPTSGELKTFLQEVRRQRVIPDVVLNILRQMPVSTNPMAWLRTAVSALSGTDPDAEDNSEVANFRKAVRLTGQLSTLVAAIDRVRKGKPIVPPDPSLDIADNFLYMLTGKKPDELAHRALDMAMILQADHELNASTFAARVTVSTLSDMHSGVTSAIGTLKGPLHGGANQAVMEMLKTIGAVDKVEAWLQDQLAAKKKIMGFGHRVYTVFDPRAAVLKVKARELSQKMGPAKWFEMSEIIEKYMIANKKINPNLDFYSATVFHYLGIDTDLYPLIFAMSRIIGWCTHIIEQFQTNRLIRPLTQYAGESNLKYVPITQRSGVSPISTKA
jgi:citrate synthase